MDRYVLEIRRTANHLFPHLEDNMISIDIRYQYVIKLYTMVINVIFI